MTIRVPFPAKLPIQTRRWIRNTRAPAAEIQNQLADLHNIVGYIRAKPVFQYSADLDAIPASNASSRDRWRFAFHATPWIQYLRVQFVMARRDGGLKTTASSKLTVRDSTGAIVGVATMVYGGSGFLGPSDTPSEFGTGVFLVGTEADPTVPAELDGDADYFCTFEDNAYARLVSAAVWEVAKLPNAVNNYVPNTQGTGGPILDVDRSLIAENARLMHRRYASQLWNWTMDFSYRTVKTTTTNIVDDSSTTVTTTTPGVTLDLSRRVTLRTEADGVPVVMWAYLTFVAPQTGTVRLDDSTGTALLTMSVASTAGNGWHRTTGYLPASSGKYDLRGSATAADSVRLHAVSIYELEYTADALTLAFSGLDAAPEHLTAVDFDIIVTAINGQSNVVITLIIPYSNGENSSGLRNYDSATLAAANPDWTIAEVGSASSQGYWELTFTRAALPDGTHTINFVSGAGTLNTWQFRTNDPLYDVEVSGSSTTVPTATGDSLTVIPNDAVVVANFPADSGTWGSPVTMEISAYTLSANVGGTATMTIQIPTGYTWTEPTTASNAGGWTIGSWTSPGGGVQWQCVLTRSGLPETPSTADVTFSTTISGSGDVVSVSYTVDLTAGGYTATQAEGEFIMSEPGGGSLAPIAALLGAGPR